MKTLHINCVPFSSDSTTPLTREVLLHLAIAAEEGGVDALLFADMGFFIRPCSGNLPDLDPVLTCAALAAVTRHIGLIPSASPLIIQPYNLARRLAALDHISVGRAGWHLPDGLSDAAMAAYGHPTTPAESWPALSTEFIHVAKQLWHSWSEQAITIRSDGRSAVEGSGNHPIRHQGTFFAVQGPLDIPRPPQGSPLILQQVHTTAMLEVALNHADIILPPHHDAATANTFRQTVNQRARQIKRDPATLCIMPTIIPLLADNPADAQQQAEQYRHAHHPEHPIIAGTADQIADTLEQAFVSGAVDGFNLLIPATINAMHAINQQLITLLQARGVFQPRYRDSTLRQRYQLPDRDTD